MLHEFLKAFFSLFVIMDVLGNIPIFMSFSKKLKKKERAESANRALTYATIILLIFLFLGDKILKFFSISISSFQVGAGIIILIVGLEMVLGFKLREKHYEKYEFAIVPLATPLITGPGVIATLILLVSSFGLWITFAASAANLLLS